MNTRSKRAISVLLAFCMIFAGLSVSAFAGNSELSEEVTEVASASMPFPFSDVPQEAWYTSAVLLMHSRNIMLGTSPNIFSPHTDMSRAMAVAALFRMEYGRPANSGDSRDNPFHDVPESVWFAPYVSWAYRNDIVNGDGGGYFVPYDAMTREAFATMLHRYVRPNYGVRVSTLFPDIFEVSMWAEDGVHWAILHGFLRGTDAGMLNPQGATSRAEGAMILARFLDQQK